MRRTKGPPLAGDRGRTTTIADVEAAIASRWYRKDAAFQIEGLPKTRLGESAGFTIYRIDAEWIRDNLDTTFGTGGHGLVHTFIPLDEIWVDDREQPWPQVALHEAVEFHHMMEQNDEYWAAHQKALRAEHHARATPDTLEDLIVTYAPERKSGVRLARR